jgi:hypothetical protein
MRERNPSMDQLAVGGIKPGKRFAIDMPRFPEAAKMTYIKAGREERRMWRVRRSKNRRNPKQATAQG